MSVFSLLSETNLLNCMHSGAIFAEQGNHLLMAVQPRHLIDNRELIGLNEGNRTVFNNGAHQPIYGMTNWNSQPIYVSNISDSMPTDNAVRTSVPDDAGTGLTCNLLVTRKRSRDPVSFPSTGHSLTFLGEDISLEIQQQQLEIDQLVAMHAEQMKLYMQERRSREMRRIVETVEQKMVKKLRERDEEIAKIGQINWNLQEKVKSLCSENELWRDLAQRNEMTANALKSNLEQMLLDQIQLRQEHDNQHQLYGGGAADGVLEVSFCSSNSINGGGLCDESERREAARSGGGGGGERLCRRCGTEESSVLLLPCRHLCVCSGCGSSVETCPICQCTKNGSVNINLSF